jgi:hypothetical protein
VSLPRAKESIRPPIFFLFSLSAFPIRISELGPVHTGRPPPGIGGMAVGVFARLQHSPGIRQWDPRELGPDLCLNMGPKIRDWVPAQRGGQIGGGNPNGWVTQMRVSRGKPRQRVAVGTKEGELASDLWTPVRWRVLRSV